MIGLISMAGKNTKLRCEFLRGGGESRLWDGLFSVSGLHLIHCLMANTNSVRFFFFFSF